VLPVALDTDYAVVGSGLYDNDFTDGSDDVDL